MHIIMLPIRVFFLLDIILARSYYAVYSSKVVKTRGVCMFPLHLDVIFVRHADSVIQCAVKLSDRTNSKKVCLSAK
jgi:hypothetical protein